MKIPDNKQWSQTNEGNLKGILHETQNMNINPAGQLELAYKSFSLYNSQKDSDFGYVQAIEFYDGEYIAVTDDEAFGIGLDGNGNSQIPFTPSLSNNTDAKVCFDRLYVSRATDLAYYDGSWTDTVASLSDNPHPIAVFDSLPTFKLAVGDGNSVRTYNSSHAANTDVLTLPSQYTVTCLEYRSGYLYVGTRSSTTDEARVFIWNGNGSNAQYEVNMGAQWVFALTPFGSTVAAITDSGELSLISGSSKLPLAALPVFYNKNTRWLVDSSPDFGRVHNNGMVTDGESILINLDGDTSQGFIPEMKTGVWEYNQKTGLNHKYSYSADNLVRDQSLTLADNVITTSANHMLKDGDSVVFSTTGGLVGVDSDIEYYVSVESANEIKLYQTKTALLAGKNLTITGTPTTADDLIYIQNSDYYADNATVGAISLTTYQKSQPANVNTQVLFGSRVDDQDGNTFYTVNAVSSTYNIGHIITQRLYSSAIKDNWNELYIYLDGVLTENDTVTVKVSTSDQERKVKLQGVWASTTEISNFSTNHIGAFDNVQKGDEIVLIDGYGRGQSVNVVDKQITPTTVRLTVDKAIGLANSQVSFYFTNYQVVKTLTKDNLDKGVLKSQLLKTKASPWVMIKLVVTGFDVAIQQIEPVSPTNRGT
jgi:hypothetical protein